MNQHKMYFEISERKLLLRAVDLFVVFLALYSLPFFFHFNYFSLTTKDWLWTVTLAFYLQLFASIFEMYQLQVASNYYLILKSTILTTSTTVIIFLSTPIVAPELPNNRWQIFVFYCAIFISLAIWRIFYVQFLASNRFLQKVVLISNRSQIKQLVIDLEYADPYYKIIGWVSSDKKETDLGDLGHIPQVPIGHLTEFVNANGVSELVVASKKTEGITTDLYHQLIVLLESGKNIREYVQVYENKTMRIPVHQIQGDFYRFFPFSRSNQNKLYLYLVRVGEIVLCLIGLLITMVITPILWVLNFFWNPGPLFYTQERIGKNGQVFTIYKFRSMVQDAEAKGAVFTQSQDSRVSSLGRFMRKTRLDEFPQFLNILKGDMAVIGPRPERPIFVNEISAVMPFYETRHVIKPGLTGWAQVNYNYGESIAESLIKLQYDLYYIKHRSVYLDISILFKTLSTVLFYRGQ